MPPMNVPSEKTVVATRRAGPPRAPAHANLAMVSAGRGIGGGSGGWYVSEASSPGSSSSSMNASGGVGSLICRLLVAASKSI